MPNVGLGGGFVFVPAGVFHVAVDNAVDFSLKEFFGNGFYFFAGMPPQTSPDLMCVPCRWENVVVNGATVYNGVMSYGNIISDI